MSVQVAEQVVGILGCSGVPIPLFDVEGEQCFIAVALGLLVDFRQVLFEVDFEVLVKVFAEEMSCAAVSAGSDVRRDLEIQTTTVSLRTNNASATGGCLNGLL